MSDSWVDNGPWDASCPPTVVDRVGDHWYGTVQPFDSEYFIVAYRIGCAREGVEGSEIQEHRIQLFRKEECYPIPLHSIDFTTDAYIASGNQYFFSAVTPDDDKIVLLFKNEERFNIRAITLDRTSRTISLGGAWVDPDYISAGQLVSGGSNYYSAKLLAYRRNEFIFHKVKSTETEELHLRRLVLNGEQILTAASMVEVSDYGDAPGVLGARRSQGVEVVGDFVVTSFAVGSLGPYATSKGGYFRYQSYWIDDLTVRNQVDFAGHVEDGLTPRYGCSDVFNTGPSSFLAVQGWTGGNDLHLIASRWMLSTQGKFSMLDYSVPRRVLPGPFPTAATGLTADRPIDPENREVAYWTRQPWFPGDELDGSTRELTGVQEVDGPRVNWSFDRSGPVDKWTDGLWFSPMNEAEAPKAAERAFLYSRPIGYFKYMEESTGRWWLTLPNLQDLTFSKIDLEWYQTRWIYRYQVHPVVDVAMAGLDETTLVVVYPVVPE